MSIATILTSEHFKDVIYWFLFLGGMLLYLLKKANDSVVISKKYSKRRDYLLANWVTALIRGVFEFPLYWAWRHIPLALLLTFAHVPQNIYTFAELFWVNPFTAIVIGYFADTLLVSLAHWQRIPETIRLKISEQIPELPMNGNGGPH